MEWLTAAVVLLMIVPVPARTQEAGTSTDASSRASIAVEALMRHYRQNTGLWDTEGWWGAANSTTVLGEGLQLNLKGATPDVLQNTFISAQKTYPMFRNQFYDDEGWWALAWITAYDVTHRHEYLKMAKSIFGDMAGGWDDTCGGGIWWKKDRHYKNAIANELFLSVAAHLAARSNGKEHDVFLSWAEREWSWFQRSGMINSDHLVNDGLDSNCQNNGRTTWTYNQGVIVGGLAELSRLSKDSALLQQAQSIAQAAVSHLADSNFVLHDRTEPRCSEDTVQFKGILARNLLALYRIAPDGKLATVIRANADSIWNTARTADNEFSCSWSGPAEPRGAGATTSALGALIIAAAIQ